MDNRILSRRQFLKSSFSVASAAALASAFGFDLLAPAEAHSEAKAGPERPNIIFVFADQLRACSVGCYGEPEVDTPHLDLLATQGVRFARAISTSPLSAPYRACMQTGRYSTVTGVRHNMNYLPVDEVCIAEVLGSYNYRTAFIGKWYLDNVPVDWDPCDDPLFVPPERRQGNQWWLGFNGGHTYYGGGYYKGNDPVMRTLKEGVYEPDFQFGQAIEYIEAHQDERFCLVMSNGTPHRSTCGSLADPPGGNYHFPYDPAALTLRPNFDYPEPDEIRAELAVYYGMISNFDWNVGRLMAALDELGLADNTVLAISSDHGGLFGSHYVAAGHCGKEEIWAESLDVPFILRYPRRVRPKVLDHLFTAVDVMPTLLGLCGVPVPSQVMGRNFAPLLLNGEAPLEPPWGPVPSPDEAFVGMFGKDWLGVCTPRYTMRCDTRLRPDLLYDNLQDPYQLTNLVDDPAYRKVRSRLQADATAWLAYVQPRA